MLQPDIYNIYKHFNGKRHDAGRFLVHDGKIRMLEDYYGDSDVPEGAIDDYSIARISRPKPGTSIVSHGDMRSGKRLDLIPEADLNQPMPQAQDVTPEMIQQHLTKLPAPVWHYQRAGHDMAHTLESHGAGKFSLDGNPLGQDELNQISDNLKMKTASLRYKGDGVVDTIAKMESMFDGLRKEEDEMHPADALRHVEAAHKAGMLPPGVLDALRKQIYTDPMTGGVMGNKYAYNEWRNNPPQGGVHVALDANHFKQINDLYGHEAGDSAIKAAAHAIRSAADEVTDRGPGSAKVFRGPDQDVFRPGGDEFSAWMPSHDHAARFARSLRSHLEQIPPVGGTHRISMSMGMGADPHSADAALYKAKSQKMADPITPRFTPATIPHVLAHSDFPGKEGPIPSGPDPLPQIKMPEGAKVEPSQPEEIASAPTPKMPTPSPTINPSA